MSRSVRLTALSLSIPALPAVGYGAPDLRNYAGQPDLAIEHFKTSLRLSPRDRMGTFSLPLGSAYFLKHQFGDAAAILLASLEQAPGLPVAYQLLAACYAHMGRLDEAREIVQRLRAITPIVVPSVTP